MGDPSDARYTFAAQRPPFELPPAVALRPGSTYATRYGSDWKVDLFLPRTATGELPAAVYIHGGAWRHGSRQQFWRQAARLAECGIIGACLQYPLVPSHRYPRQIELLQEAVRWLGSDATGLAVDRYRIAAVGSSAGGHLAALLGTLEVDGSPQVRAVVAFNGVFDVAAILAAEPPGRSGAAVTPEGGTDVFTAVHDLLDGNATIAVDASPYWRAGSRSAATLMLHGDRDTVAPYEQSLKFHQRLRELGVQSQLYTETGADHAFFNLSPYYERTLPVVERFLIEHLSPLSVPSAT
jgi:acetyl esterase/lipase